MCVKETYQIVALYSCVYREPVVEGILTKLYCVPVCAGSQLIEESDIVLYSCVCRESVDRGILHCIVFLCVQGAS